MSKKKKQKSKRTKSKKKRVSSKAAPIGKNSRNLQLISYEITYEPLKNSTIPEEIEHEIEILFEKAQTSPGTIIERLKELIKKYPHVPQLYNYISVAYSNLGNNKKVAYYAKKNYQKNPHYLFARGLHAGRKSGKGSGNIGKQIRH